METTQNLKRLARLPGAKVTIGLLRFMYREWDKNEFLEGVSAAAEDEGVNLICFTDQRLDEATLQRGWLYDLATPERLDGLIIGGTIGFYVGKALLEKYCRRFECLPCVSAATQLEAIPWLAADGYGGMYQIAEHLITTHGLSRIAFIRGPEAVSDAESRYQAYQAALAAHHLPLDPQLVAQGDYTLKAGRVALERWLAQGVSFQAVAAANDSMALGVLEGLQAHGVPVPQAVAVTGFDDLSEARLAALPLTTVRQNMYQEGYQAVLTLLRRLRGEAVPARVLLPAELVVRQSCGCMLPAPLLAQTLETSATLAAMPELGVLADQCISALAGLQKSLPRSGVSAAVSLWGNQTRRVCAAFLADLQEGGAPRFWPALQTALLQTRLAGESLEGWQLVVVTLGRQAWPLLRTPDRLRRAGVLLQQGQALVDEALQRWQAYQRTTLDLLEWQLQTLETELTTVVTLEELAQVLRRHLPEFSIRRFFLALYSDRLGGRRTQLMSAEPDWRQLGQEAELCLQYDETQGLQPVSGQLYPTRQLAPDAVFPERRYTFVLQPLIFNGQHLGLVGYERGVVDAALLGRLTAQLSHTLFRIYLIQLREHAQRGLEQRAAELVLANQELEAFSYSVSHDLRAPLRTISGYSQVLLEDYAAHIDLEGQRLLSRIQSASAHMAELIDDLLRLSRVLRTEVHFVPVDLSALVYEIMAGLKATAPERRVEGVVAPDVIVTADPNLMRIALENLLKNAWKFTAKHTATRIEFGVITQDGKPVYFVRDDGAGFDMAYVHKLFGAFQRLHTPDEFEGTGIGLTIVQRIIRRHGGQIWAEGTLEQGATFYFTLRRGFQPADGI